MLPSLPLLHFTLLTVGVLAPNTVDGSVMVTDTLLVHPFASFTPIV